MKQNRKKEDKMIRNRLNELMKIKKVRVKDLNEQLGLSNAAILKIRENTALQIRYDTLDKLCKFFNVTPNEFFEYTPLDINIELVTACDEIEKIKEADKEPNKFITLKFPDIALFVYDDSIKYHYLVEDCKYVPNNLFYISFISAYDFSHDLKEAYPDAQQTDKLIKDWNSLSGGFKNDLKKKLYDFVEKGYGLEKSSCKIIIDIDFLDDDSAGSVY